MRHLPRLILLLAVSVAALAGTPIEVTSTGTWSSGTYAYDGSGNIKTIGTNGYLYDTAGRLVSANVNGTSILQTYAYDAFGNRKQSTTSPAHACIGGIDCEENVTIDPATNRINSTANAPAYDAAGNLTGLDGVAYAYDGLSMLRSQSNTGAQFVYTADDERLATISSGGTWNWTVRDVSAQVLSDFTSTNGTGTIGTANFQWKKDYIYRDGLLLAATTSSGTQHFHLDHLGTPRLITDANGAELAAHTYFPFGAELAISPTESPTEAMKFTGHERDATGAVADLDYMHARYYSGSLGRFLTPDPLFRPAISRPQSLNPYIYADNNPVRNFDPTGYATKPCEAIALGAAKAELFFNRPIPHVLLGPMSVGLAGISGSVSRIMRLGDATGYAFGGGASAGRKTRAIVEDAVTTIEGLTLGMGVAGMVRGALVGGIARSAVATESTVSLYRAVDAAEAADIVGTRAFKPAPNGTEFKGFFFDEESARAFGEAAAERFGGQYSVAAAEAPASLVEASPVHSAAGEGAGVLISNEDLWQIFLKGLK
jgi:RHS repeat-associated protein